MEMMPLKPERKAQLEEYAKRRGQDPVTALDEALATYLDWECRDFAESVEGIHRGLKDVKSGNTRPADAVLDDLRRKHDIPR
jgi:predicted transcriptional regulator